MTFDPRQESFQHLGHLLAEAPQMVVFVIGAGLSIPAGLPSWPKLSKDLRIEAINYLKDSPAISESEKESRIGRINGLTDLWLLGDEIEATLPRDTYQKVVRRELGTERIPETYHAIWQLNPSGMISFNLDALASRSLNGTDEQVATATEPAKFQRFLLFSGRSFLLQPHGSLKTPESWVLGARRRNWLLKNDQYRRFLNGLLSSRRLVLVGLQANDFAFESLLLGDFRDSLSQGVEHFWITSTVTPERKAWADLYNIKPIVYQSSDLHHPEVLDILRQLKRIPPRVPPAPLAYEGETIDPESLPQDEELRGLPVEDIRRKLNAALAGLLKKQSDPNGEQGKLLSAFYRDFSGSVHMAWHITADPQYGWVWGRKVEKSLGEGGFGKVWKVRDAVDGTTLALKVLHEDVIDQEGFVNAFRRGVSAMRILKERGVEGIVRLADAYDIPSCLLMEYIEGDTLEEAIKGGAIGSLRSGIEVLQRVASIVRAGHELRERVLHRDLKPSNVMIRNLWTGRESDFPQDVVVLDFDLSWYEGAYGRSTFHGKGITGYLAPEQHELNRSKGTSSRHTAVDVFGLGMLLFFVATGRDPDINEQQGQAFLQDVVEAIKDKWGPEFNSLPTYIAETIVATTKREQRKRMGLPALQQRLDLLCSVLTDQALPLPSDLALLEIATRFDATLWVVKDERELKGRIACIDRAAGATVELYFEPEHGDRMAVRLGYAAGGDIDRGSIEKYTRTKAEKAAALLREGGFLDIDEVAGSGGSVTIDAKTRPQVWDIKTIISIAERVAAGSTTLAFRETN